MFVETINESAGFLKFLLKYKMLLDSNVQQSESAIRTQNPLGFGFPSYLGHHRALSRVPSAIQ